jgi:hypothetical protein
VSNRQPCAFRRLKWQLGWRCTLLIAVLLLPACTPSPEMNVVTYLVEEQLGTAGPTVDDRPTGSLTGMVTHQGEPVAGASVVVAERWGEPHSAQTDEAGRYRIDAIPLGQYVPAAVAVDFEEAIAQDRFGLPRLVTIEAGQTAEAPDIELVPYESTPLPSPLAPAVNLMEIGTYTATAPFPAGSAAQVRNYSFEVDGIVNRSLRVYLPIDAEAGAEYPMLFVVYPGPTQNWEDISVALSSPGYAVVALAPAPERALDIDGHAWDARIAFNLALDGSLGPGISDGKAVVMGGSFSSPIVRRFLLDESDKVAGWITLGGISDGFKLARDFYDDSITVPEMHNLAIPSLGMPNLFPLPFLRYSTVYAAGELVPTFVIHTVADEVTRVEQAYDLQAAMEAAGIPVEASFYNDVSHYLQIGEYMTEAGEAMYYHVLDFVERYTSSD